MRQRYYLPELDGLRLCAFLFVFVTHAFSSDATDYLEQGFPAPLAHLVSNAVRAGGHGVPLFFLLSAFLITELLLREHRQNGSLDPLRFYARRALRIWPLYLSFVVVVCAVLRLAHRDESAFSTDYLWSLLLFYNNYAIALGVTPSPVDSVSGSLWTVSIEEQFYVLWPLLLAVAGPARFRALAIALIALPTAGRLAMDVVGTGAGPGGWSTPPWFAGLNWLDSFGAGAFLAVALDGRLPRFTAGTRALLFVAGPALWGAAAVAAKVLPAGSVLYALVVLGSVLLFLSAIGGRLLAAPPLAYLGRISFGLYVFHQAALTVAALFFPRSSIAGGVLGLTLTIAASVVSYRLLETPFLRLKQRFTYVESRPV